MSGAGGNTTEGTEVERLAQEGRQRIVDGVVDAWGKHRPEGPRKTLTEAQRRAYDRALAGEGEKR